MIEGIKMSGGEEEGGLQKLEGIRVKEGERGKRDKEERLKGKGNHEGRGGRREREAEGRGQKKEGG